MDYSNFTNGNFLIDYSHNLVAYFSDGTTKVIDDTGRTASFEATCYLVANEINRDSNYNIGRLVGYSYYFDNDTSNLYYVATSKQDFYIFNAVNNGDIMIDAVRTYDQYSDFDDYGLINNYALYYSSPYNYNNRYGSYSVELQLPNNNSVFDYSSIYYENGAPNSYMLDTLVVRGENVSFYNTYFYIQDIETGDLNLAYGSPINDIAYSEYERGEQNGYATGHTQGVQDGYTQGINANGNIGTQQATAFSYIGTAFNSVGQLLSIEILPNITLGLCFSIPLVFVLILTIFKLVRK